jgi:hypothetical protein
MKHPHRITPLLVLISTINCHIALSADDSYVSAMDYVSVDVQGDDANSRDQSITASVGLGKYTWLQGTLGKLSDSSSTGLGDQNHFDAGVGLQGKRILFKIDANRYANSDVYRQRDVNVTLEWRDDRFTVGVDGMHRRTDNSLDEVRDFPRLNVANVALHMDETLTGHGFGAHAILDITDNLSAALGGMSYSYDSSYDLSSSTNPLLVNVLRNYLDRHPTISNTFYLNHSGITRSQALLDSTYHAGLSYQFSSAIVSVDYAIDNALDTDDQTRTFSISGSFFVGDHVMISPLIGQSRSDTAEDVNFGGLSASYNW